MNYQHLFYFFTVAKQGGVSAAARALDLAPSTLSAQIRLLEASMGTPLFERKGRAMILTDAGRVAYGYAENIFSLGDELRSKLKSNSVAPPPSAPGP